MKPNEPPDDFSCALRTATVDRAQKVMRIIAMELREHGLYWSEISDIWTAALGGIPNDYPKRQENRTS